MAGDTIGTARVDIVIDTAQYELAIQRAKNAAVGFGEDAEKAFDGQNSMAKRAAKSLLDFVANLGKSREEIRLLKAAGSGVDPVIIEAATVAMNEYRRGLAAVASETERVNALHVEALQWDAERSRQQGGGADFESQQRAAQEAWRRAEATEALTLALHRQDAAEALLRNSARIEEEERAAQAAWRRAEATEALSIALMREDAAEANIQGAQDFAAQQQAAQLAWRRAEATQVLTAELERLEAAEKAAAANAAFLTDLKRQEQQIGLTRTEVLELRAAEMGLTSEAAPLIASMKRKEAAMGKYATQLEASKRKMNEYGLSQKQLEFAMRGVPAQITDIFVSLQGGQAPLTVLLQQGGQLKDMFGGIRPAAAALGSQLMALITPVTATGAVLAAMGIAAYQGSKEMRALNEAAILTGNNMGVTGDRLNAMAQSLAATSEGTRGAAADAVAAAAATGRFTADQLEVVSRAANTMKRDVGVAVEDTVAEFVKLRKDPVAALVELNEKMHFLTAAQYENIRALQAQGRETEAQTEAMRLYAETIEERGKQVVENLGWLESGWRALGKAAKWSWDQMMDIGREDSLESKLREQTQVVQKWTSDLQAVMENPQLSGNKDIVDGYRDGLLLRRQELLRLLKQYEGDKTKAEIEAARQSANETYIANGQLIDSQATKAVKKRQEIAAFELRMDKAIKDAQLAGELILATDLASQRAAGLAAIEKKYEEKQKKKSGNNDEQRAALQKFKDEAEITSAAIAANVRSTQAAYQANTISAADYFGKMRAFAAEELAANEKSILGQLSYLHSAKDSIKNRQKIGELEAELAKVRSKALGDATVLNEQEAATTKKRREEMQDYTNALNAAEIAQRRNIDAQVTSVGLGNNEAQRVAAVTKLYTEQADKLFQLATLKTRNPGNADMYAEQEAALRASTERQVGIVNDGFAMMEEARGNWLNGYSRAFQNYSDEMRNVAGHTEQFFGDVTGGIEGMLTDLAINGKATVTSLTNSIIKDLIRLGTQKMLVWLMSMWGGGGPSAGASSGTMANFGNNAGWTVNAKGNVYDSASLSKYSNGVYTTPQTFAFAKGAGIFAEAGPEAIMPLSRGADGKLGVQATGGGRTGGVIVNLYGAPEGTEVKQEENADGTMSIDVLLGQIESKIAGNIAAGSSPVGTAMKARYQLRENA